MDAAASILFWMIVCLDIGTGAISAASDYDCESTKLYNIWPSSSYQTEYVRSLGEKDPSLDFWKLTSILNETIEVMVPAESNIQFETNLNKENLQFKSESMNTCLNARRVTRKIALPTPLNHLDVTSMFLYYDEINNFIDQLVANNPNVVKVKTIAKSYESRLIRAVTISSGRPKKTILIDAGIHAREWIAPSTALYLMKKLVESKNLRGDITWIIVPLVNPDGYEYSRKSEQYWRKSRQTWGRCKGTDLNRNFDFKWGVAGASANPCSDTYRGPKAFSDPESLAIRSIMESQKVDFYLTLHSYGRLLLYPWGYKKGLSSNWRQADVVAKAGAKAMSIRHNVRYNVGGAANVLYEAAGGSDDYAVGAKRIPIAITMELPPSSGSSGGFHPDPGNIKSYVEEAFTGIMAMAHTVARMKY